MRSAVQEQSLQKPLAGAIASKDRRWIQVLCEKTDPKILDFFLALKTRFFFRKNKLYLFKLKKLKFFIYKKGSRGAAPGPPKIGAICDQWGARMDEAWVDLGGTSYE